jgi:hypothetical protein
VHNDINHTLAELLREDAYVVKEPFFPTANINQHPDLKVYKNPVEYVDVSVANVSGGPVIKVSPATAANVRAPKYTSDRLPAHATYRELTKSRKYAALCAAERAKFCAFVLDSTGAFGGSALSFMARHFKAARDYDPLLQENRLLRAQQTIVFSLHRMKSRKILHLASSVLALRR